MPDIDKIIEQLLNERRMSESATFSMRSYSDQPLIEKGSDLKARMERRAQARAAKHEREARERRDKARSQDAQTQDASQGQRQNAASGNRQQQTDPEPFGASLTGYPKTQKRRTDQGWEGTLQDQMDAQQQGGSPAWQRRENAAQPEGPHSSGERLNSGARLFMRDQWRRVTDDAPSSEVLPQRILRFAYGLEEQLDEFQERHLGRRMRLPEPVRQMRALEGAGIPSTLSYGSSAAAALFYRQAELMEDYEDDYTYRGSFIQYYPTYAAMSDNQLRGYFTWRTKVRAGQMEPAPLSFAFLHAYELLMGIGTTPGEQGLADLQAFSQAYREVDEAQGIRLNAYLRVWLTDYAIYHDIPSGYQRKAIGEQETAVLTLFKAEHAFLEQSGRKPHIPHPAAAGAQPTDEQLFQALGAASSYHICTSRLAKHEPELVQAVACDVFRALVMHCSKRRKTDYVEGLFGYATRVPYTMFSTAVFYEEEPHPDCKVQVSDADSYECKNGRWWHTRACENISSNSELGLAMHAVDFELRQRLDYAYPLKRREVPKYLWKIVRDTVSEHLERRAEAERRKITIDLSKLSGIRAAAAVTQEALLTDEERGELPGSDGAGIHTSDTPFVASTIGNKPDQLLDSRPHNGQQLEESFAGMREGGTSPATYSPVATASPTDTAGYTDKGSKRGPSADAASRKPHGGRPHNGQTEGKHTGLQTDDVAAAPHGHADIASSADTPLLTPEQDGPLTPEEARLVAGLLAGESVADLLGTRAQFVSVVVDSINEKLFDVVGDTVIEFDGEEPCIVEDYLEDVREVLHT